ncbi:MAG: hypothetical protein J5838_04055 [Desulfovibrio sp.]|nr:hypothetical protein [Desulfovibrio sp.]
MALLIPATTPFTYISGLAALSIPTGKNVSAPAGGRRFEFDKFLWGRGTAVDTLKYWGCVGVEDRSAQMKLCGMIGKRHAEPVYAASHERACADLFVRMVFQMDVFNFFYLGEWFPSDAAKERVYAFLNAPGFVTKLTAAEKQKLARWKRLQSEYTKWTELPAEGD